MWLEFYNMENAIKMFVQVQFVLKGYTQCNRLPDIFVLRISKSKIASEIAVMKAMTETYCHMWSFFKHAVILGTKKKVKTKKNVHKCTKVLKENCFILSLLHFWSPHLWSLKSISWPLLDEELGLGDSFS